MNFYQAYTALIDSAARSDERLLPAAKREINSACQRACRAHAFHLSMASVDLTFEPGQDASITFDDGRRFRSVHAAATEDGDPIPVMSLVTAFARDYNIKSKIAHNYRYALLLTGTSFQLLPQPSTETIIRVYCSTLPAPLVDDEDSNFLLDFVGDYIVMSALAHFNVYLKESEQVVITRDQMMQDWEQVLAWDASLTTSMGLKYGDI